MNSSDIEKGFKNITEVIEELGLEKTYYVNVTKNGEPWIQTESEERNKIPSCCEEYTDNSWIYKGVKITCL